MQYRYPTIKILIFTKPPLAGKCKTRLIPCLGEHGAAQLQESLLLKIISDLIEFNLCPFEIWQSEESNYFTQLQVGSELVINTQQGNDLGERMSNAMSNGLLASEGVLIIGSDCAEYTESYFEKAIRSLLNQKSVIGPAYDGGYLLIGLTRLYPELFLNIKWGSSQVLARTLKALNNLSIHYSTLEPLHDIDRPEDLPLLRKIEPNLTSNQL